MRNKKNVERVPVANQLADQLLPRIEPAPGEKLTCSVCEHVDTFSCGLFELLPHVPICPFCVVYFKEHEWKPQPVKFSHEYELMGAWADFSSELIDYEANVASQYRAAKRRQELALPEALQQWAMGSTIGDGQGVQFEMLDDVWAVLALGHILPKLEMAITAADQLMYRWRPDTVAATLNERSIQPVWDLWVAANAEGGLTKKSNGRTVWRNRGINYYETCGKFRNSDVSSVDVVSDKAVQS
jgi:hypothetical protein